MDENKKPKTKILMILLIIALFTLAFIISININNMKIENKEQTEEIETLKLITADINQNILAIEDGMLLLKYYIADAWIAMQSNETKNKIDKFWIENTEFTNCYKEEIDISVLKNWYDNKIESFRLLVITYKQGSLVFYPDGEVKCYPPTIQEMNPDDIPCVELCQQ